MPESHEVKCFDLDKTASCGVALVNCSTFAGAKTVKIQVHLGSGGVHNQHNSPCTRSHLLNHINRIGNDGVCTGRFLTKTALAPVNVWVIFIETCSLFQPTTRIFIYFFLNWMLEKLVIDLVLFIFRFSVCVSNSPFRAVSVAAVPVFVVVVDLFQQKNCLVIECKKLKIHYHSPFTFVQPSSTLRDKLKNNWFRCLNISLLFS